MLQCTETPILTWRWEREGVAVLAILLEDVIDSGVLVEADHAELVHHVYGPPICVQQAQSVGVGPPGGLTPIPVNNKYKIFG